MRTDPGPVGDADHGELVELLGESEAMLDKVRDPRTGEFLVPLRRPENRALADQFQSLALAVNAQTAGSVIYTAVLDTGLLREHPALEGRIVEEVDFTGEGPNDQHGHGTIVALIMAADVVERRFVNVKVVGRSGRARPDALISGLNWVLEFRRKHPDVLVDVNASVGIYRRRLGQLVTCDGTCEVCEAAAALGAAGVAVGAAAGNRRGVTTCPAAHGVRFPHSGVAAIASYEFASSGFGNVAVASRTRLVPQSSQLELEAIEDLEEGLDLGRQGNHEGARKAFVRAATNETKVRPLARFNLGIALLRLGQRDAAKDALTAAEEWSDPVASPQAAEVLGQLAAEDGDEPAAIRAYRAAIAGNHPEASAKAAFQLGVLLNRAGDPDGAACAFADAVSDGHPTYGPRSALQLGLLEYNRDRRSLALEAFQIAAAGDEPDAAARGALGVGTVLEESRDLEGARRAYTRALNSGVADVAAAAQRSLATLSDTE